MRLLQQWLSELTRSERVLDLGCGPGSMRNQLSGLNVVGMDVDPKQRPTVCGVSQNLPFADGSFDFVVSNHSLEHFRDAEGAIREIGRVLKPGGRLFVSVPEGASFSDRLYRLMFCGGDHWQRFSFRSAVDGIERGTGLALAGSQELFSSFLFVEKRRFLPAPRGPLPGPFPRRMRWLGHLPGWSFAATRWVLHAGTRVADRVLGTSFSRYGWALAFSGGERGRAVVEPGWPNVCMHCGAGVEAAEIVSVRRLFYRCPECARLNWFYRGR